MRVDGRFGKAADDSLFHFGGRSMLPTAVWTNPRGAILLTPKPLIISSRFSYLTETNISSGNSPLSPGAASLVFSNLPCRFPSDRH